KEGKYVGRNETKKDFGELETRANGVGDYDVRRRHDAHAASLDRPFDEADDRLRSEGNAFERLAVESDRVGSLGALVATPGSAGLRRQALLEDFEVHSEAKRVLCAS